MNQEQIIEAIGQMSVVELSELVKAVEKKFGVSAALPVMAAPVSSAAGGEDAGGSSEQTSFSVELVAAGGQKIQVIKALRELTQLGLKEAKDLADAAPKIIREGVDKAAAEEMKKKLEEAGATVNVK